MIVQGEERIDGLEVTTYQLRFAGTLDLETDEAEKMALDRVVVFVVATRQGKTEYEVMDTGEVRRKNVAKVSDSRVMTGEMRDRAISFLAHGEDVTDLALTAATHTPEATQIDKLAQFLMQFFPKEIGDEGAVDCAMRLLANGAVMSDEDRTERPLEDEGSEDELGNDVSTDVSAFDPPEEVGHVASHGLSGEEGNGAGPKVGKFRPDEGPSGPQVELGEREVIGSIYPEGHRGRDPHLARLQREAANEV